MNIFQAETAQKLRMVQAALKIKNGQSYKKECTYLITPCKTWSYRHS